ncbi:YgfZ/GcvT domain-containing protein [Lichenibacterium dinghuense]|uniref:CAF17-like 4Fe-4S cluster assembly/insertion protein YgfZ n=1 Tax=Lichenibacterium dinghuense TaxID=2895977 RepID=UPI001F356DE5|nr:folate-binding protein [Lichenibacterium sp. 6Y81]
MGTAFLDDRGIVEVEGPDARALLHRLVTSDVTRLASGEIRYAALLSPQGKIAADFLIVEASPPGGPDRFLLDVPAAQAADLAKKLTLYRLRADVRIADRSAELGVTAHWPDGPGARDPRHPDLGTRAIGPRSDGDSARRHTYEAHRIALGVPDGGRDYAFGDAFPHDANLDRLGGVDFGKGCYVGQEVVSRVHHRGTARKRVVPVAFDGRAPAPGAEITVNDVAIGTMGTSADGRGLATVRVDRAAEAAGQGAPAVADGVALTLSLS